ncbi:three-helix bundle dimerization domain-containing protein [Demequina mangrovi]|uniref:Protein-tyrosine-phosphatase-like N-terminal domain-containing protein n=1 Tax=Demequina mangrovi TaxID=1043493 RepID=A0A1H6XFP6_9MICO|nr:hypothetical protein [Demequina mangrovi]SEJ26334.1 hypothetical protein SAMN05421637_1371 [Demequina mangrovi]
MTLAPANGYDREAHPEHVERALVDAIDHLAEHFPEFERDEVARVVRHSYASLSRRAHVHQHLVTLAEHSAWQHLHDLRALEARAAKG